MADLSLVVFDLDGVLVPIRSSWAYVHERMGVKNDENLRLYLAGKITYEEFMERDIALWKGASLRDIQEILSEVPLTEGAVETCSELKRIGLDVWIFSSGINLLAERVASVVGASLCKANVLHEVNGVVRGVAVVEPLKKKEELELLLKEKRLGLANVVYVGDNEFDIPLLRSAKVGIAFNPSSPEVSASARYVVRSSSLADILPAIRAEVGKW